MNIDTTPAEGPLPDGFPSMKDPTMIHPPIHAKQLRWHDHQAHIHATLARSGNLPATRKAIEHIANADALRWEISGETVVIMPEEHVAFLYWVRDQSDGDAHA